MTSKEIVHRAIEFEKPSRLPALFGALGVSDVTGLGPRLTPEEEALSADKIDPWGCRWAQTEMKNMGQVVGHPMRAPDDWENLRLPDYTDPRRYEHLAQAAEEARASEKYVRAGIFMVLNERLQALLGFENFFMAIADDDERPALLALADKIVDAHITLVRELTSRAPGVIDGWGMSDDWGTQQAAYVSGEFWMEHFGPRYRRLFDAMQEAGCQVSVHSCGKVNEIVECYLQVGVKAVNLQQPRCLGIEEMGQRFRGRITFETLADIQATLPTGDPQRIRADARDLFTHWATPEGGLILADYGNGEAIGVTNPATKPLMYQIFSELSAEYYGEPLPPPVLPDAA